MTASPTQTDLLTYEGHFYRIVLDPSVSRNSAISAAASSTFTINGVTYQGYLATITSSAENEFIETSIKATNWDAFYSVEPASFWLGGEYTSGLWKWTSGPETGSAISYSDWGGIESSQGATEPYLVLNMYARNDINGAWYSFESTATYYIRGYVIEYRALNSPPTFASSSQSVSTNEDTAKTVTVSAIDPNGDTLTYSVSTAATNGTTSISGGTITYTPATNYNGSDSFVVTASDGKGGTSSQTVNLSVAAVNDAPTFAAAAQTVSATAGTAKAITLAAADVDGDVLNYTVATPSKGTASISGNTLTYTPGSASSGSDSFVVTASDGKGGAATQTITAVIATAAAAKAFSVYTTSGWVGSIGGNGTVYGTNGFEDITALYGQVTLDGSFNRGGDVLRVSGDAETYEIGRVSASSAYIEAGTTTKVAIPIGSAGLGIVFADGVRKLSFASGAYKIGSQTFTIIPSKITSAIDGTVLPAGADPAAQAIIYMNAEGLSGGLAADLTISGKARIFGTNAVDVIKLGAGGVDLTFDGTFNRGGDIIILDRAAGDYAAAKLNASTMVITSLDEKLTIPMGSAGLTLRFTDGDRTLVFKSGAFYIGEQAITSATATPLTPSSITISADQGVPGASVILDGTGKVTFTDDATKTTNVFLKNFGTDDVIRVTGATVSHYSFAISNNDSKDLEITYTNANTSATNSIILDDVIKIDAFIDNYQTAAAALGWNFMTFG
jgi:hypothetical protein